MNKLSKSTAQNPSPLYLSNSPSPRDSRPSTRPGVSASKRDMSPTPRRSKDVFDRLYRTGTCCSFTKVDTCHSCSHCLKSRYLTSFKRQQSISSTNIYCSGSLSEATRSKSSFTKQPTLVDNKYPERHQLQQQYPNIAHHFNYHRPSETFAQFVERHKPTLKHEVLRTCHLQPHQRSEYIEPVPIEDCRKTQPDPESTSWDRSFSEMDIKVLHWLDNAIVAQGDSSPPPEENDLIPWTS